MDGLVAQYAGGPQSQPNYAVHHATLYASKDPVALDAVALRRLEQWRAGASLPPIGSAAAYVDFASQLGLGNSAPNRIERQKYRTMKARPETCLFENYRRQSCAPSRARFIFPSGFCRRNYANQSH